MATQSLTHARLYSPAVARPRLARNLKLRIRKDYLVIRLLVAAGLTIPALMAVHFIPASFVLLGVALAFVAVGGVLWLVRCGEVA